MNKPVDASDINTFFRSVDRASADPKFLDYFYDGFMSQSDEIRAFFAHTDMENLKHKLKATLHLTSMAAQSAPGAAMYLEHLGRVHHRLNVGLELYAIWLDSLLAAVAKCDPEYDDHLEAIWRQFMNRTISVLGSQYPTTNGTTSDETD